jgi:hypothetical protein
MTLSPSKMRAVLEASLEGDETAAPSCPPGKPDVVLASVPLTVMDSSIVSETTAQISSSPGSSRAHTSLTQDDISLINSLNAHNVPEVASDPSTIGVSHVDMAVEVSSASKSDFASQPANETEEVLFLSFDENEDSACTIPSGDLETYEKCDLPVADEDVEFIQQLTIQFGAGVILESNVGIKCPEGDGLGSVEAPVSIADVKPTLLLGDEPRHVLDDLVNNAVEEVASVSVGHFASSADTAPDSKNTIPVAVTKKVTSTIGEFTKSVVLNPESTEEARARMFIRFEIARWKYVWEICVADAARAARHRNQLDHENS